MSVRIHEIAKQTGVASKEIIELLKERGYEVSTASSGIDPISAESLIEELGKKAEPEAASDPTSTESPPEEPKKQEAPESPTAPPISAFVRSKEDIDREKEEKRQEEENKRKSAATAPPIPTPPPPPAPPPSAPSPAAPPPVTPPAAAPKAAPPAPAPATPAAPVAVAPPAGAPPPLAGRPPATPGIGAPPPPLNQPADEEAAEEGESAAEASDDIKVVTVKPPIVVKEFALEIGLKPFKLISELMEMGIFSSMNQNIDEEVAVKLAERHGFLLEVKHRGEEKQPAPKKKVVEVDQSKFLEPRPPVICILGHVDHGKTTLLDHIRNANVVSDEFGGITQHIGAYQVEHGDQKITFLDTPGHAAFSKMRERGAHVTDLAILVVAADDGFMPQTDEALKFAEDSGNPIIVAINKMDSKGADIDRVKTQMQERNIAPEDWGGETISVAISALKGENVDDLLEMINLQSEVMELKSSPKGPASGTVVESQMEVGRGPTATVIVQQGTLKVGDAIVCGESFAKVRAMMDDNGKNLKSALPSTPVRIMGWSDTPSSGDEFTVVKNEKTAKGIVEERTLERRRGASVEEEEEPKKPATIETLFEAIEKTRKKVFKVVVKCDVHGSTEAVTDILEAIQSDKVDLEVITAEVGGISKQDVDLASTSDAAVIGFNVKLESGVAPIAKHAGVNIMQFNIIYEMVDKVMEAMADQLEPELSEKTVGSAEVRQLFPVGRTTVAGCLVSDGKISRDAKARVLRNGTQIFKGKISMLKRFKDDVKEVRNGYECGVQVTDFGDFEEGDVIECFEIEKKRASL
ncbi:translation initiation factor IF-2 [Opitutia bacterium ISCC 51]|nr:translation initiation factor IF-2 [Opitutae bacterium ISCC 51]QXD30027.1 translation initiation factor IF-2 [Opitutae bacterium ISCC 52]